MRVHVYTKKIFFKLHREISMLAGVNSEPIGCQHGKKEVFTSGCTPSSILLFPNLSSLQDISIHTAALLLLLFCLFDLW